MRLFANVRKHAIPLELGVVAADTRLGSFRPAPHFSPRAAWYVLGGLALGLGLLALAPRPNINESDAELLLHRAGAGSDSAQLMLALAYRDGRYGLPRDSHAAANWLTESAQSGNAYAAAMLGDAYARGEGVPADRDAARRWWSQAAQSGNAHAQYRLGRDMMQDGATQAQRDAGRDWLQRAAVGGDEQARQSLGIEGPVATSVTDRIDRGLGAAPGRGLLARLEHAMLRDNPAAQTASELKQSALAGDNVAEFQLAMRYRDGSWGVNADPRRALSWLRRSAEHGNPVAMDSLANAYDKGQLGLARDAAEAGAWRQRAEEARAAAARAETPVDNR